MNTCEHKKFKAATNINRSVTNTIDEEAHTESVSTRYFLKLTIKCEECGKIFEIQPPIFAGNSMEIVPK